MTASHKNLYKNIHYITEPAKRCLISDNFIVMDGDVMNDTKRETVIEK